MASIESLFPAGGVIDEEAQIGRTTFVARVSGRLALGRSVILSGPRQIGKSSALKAAVQRRARSGALMALTDLSAYENTPAAFVGRFVGDLDDSARIRTASGRLVRQGAAGAADLARLATLAQAARGRERDPVEVLLELGRVLPTPAVALVDEAHILGRWDDGERVLGALHSLVTAPDRRLILALASSEGSAQLRLFDSGPLKWDLERHTPPDISAADWRDGLVGRFGLLDLRIADALVDALVAATAGHPFKTMWVARELATIAEPPEAGITAEQVEAALGAARKQLWWSG